MKKLFLILIIFGMTVATAYSQLTPGYIGMGASFAKDQETANLHYCLSNNMDLRFGLGFHKTSYAVVPSSAVPLPSASSQLNLQGAFRYFLGKGKDVSPYVGGVFEYTSLPTDKSGALDITTSDLRITAIFGAQYNLAKNFGLYAHIGLGYDIVTATSKSTTGASVTVTGSTILLGTSAIGAVFYFDL